MKLSEARIGYAGYSRDFGAPGDRRRFAAYAAARGISIEYADLNRDYDLAYVTYSSDLPGWIARKRREGDRLKLVFELIDAYFTESGLLRRFLKGSARFALGIDSRLSPDLRRTLIDACQAADAVICSTEEQRDTIRSYNSNVFLSFDHFESELGPAKGSFERSGKLRIVWEGQSTTLPNLRVIRQPLNRLRDEVELHVVTDPEIRRYHGLLRTRTEELLGDFACDICFHEWDRDDFSSRVTAVDAAVIPIDASDQFAMGKPENKLVMLWKLGMPVITSATPAYQRAMDAAGLKLICAGPGEWHRQITRLIEASPDELRAVGSKGREFAERAYSGPEFLRRFDETFASLGFGI